LVIRSAPEWAPPASSSKQTGSPWTPSAECMGRLGFLSCSPAVVWGLTVITNATLLWPHGMAGLLSSRRQLGCRRSSWLEGPMQIEMKVMTPTLPLQAVCCLYPEPWSTYPVTRLQTVFSKAIDFSILFACGSSFLLMKSNYRLWALFIMASL
jgi:hypothetical protein